MTLNENINAPKVNESSLHGVGYKPFTDGASYFLNMKEPVLQSGISNEAGVYIIVSLTNGNCYVGSGINLRERKRTHFNELKKNRHSNYHLQNHYNKYSKNDLIFGIIENVSRKPAETARQFKKRLVNGEQYWIDTLKPEFNICKKADSCLGVKRTKTTIQLLSSIKKEFYIREGKESIKGENNPFFGKHHKEKSKQKEANTILKQYQLGRKNGMLGKTHTEESKQSNREKHLGHSPSKESIRKGKETYHKHPLETCPHCGKQSRSLKYLKKYHFDYCKKNPNRIPVIEELTEPCPWCGFRGRKGTSIHQFHFDNCKQNPNYIPKPDTREMLTCEYCRFRSKNKGVMIQWHFDNCKHKKNETT